MDPKASESNENTFIAVFVRFGQISSCSRFCPRVQSPLVKLNLVKQLEANFLCFCLCWEKRLVGTFASEVNILVLVTCALMLAIIFLMFWWNFASSLQDTHL